VVGKAVIDGRQFLHQLLQHNLFHRLRTPVAEQSQALHQILARQLPQVEHLVTRLQAGA
jgi:hypothetical protein